MLLTLIYRFLKFRFTLAFFVLILVFWLQWSASTCGGIYVRVHCFL